MQGRVLRSQEISTLGKTKCIEYLRAMGAMGAMGAIISREIERGDAVGDAVRKCTQ